MGPQFKCKAVYKKKQTNSVALSPQANYTDWAAATCQRNLVPTVVNLSFIDRSRYFSFK
jgi:hypothetical protein